MNEGEKIMKENQNILLISKAESLWTHSWEKILLASFFHPSYLAKTYYEKAHCEVIVEMSFRIKN